MVKLVDTHVSGACGSDAVGVRLPPSAHSLMPVFYVYAINSLTRNYIYVGISSDPDRRFDEHNRGKERTTRPYRPFKRILLEQYESRIEARKREKYLKSGAGKEFLKTLIN